MAGPTTRLATADDAEVATDVVRRSIVELCTADHEGDPATLERWLSNKNPDKFRAWVENAELYTIVAELDGQVCGVGMLGTNGVIYLCYVHPEYLRRGVGRVLVAAIEQQARAWGLERLGLDGTITAEEFYRSLGYRRAGAQTTGFGITMCTPYEKRL